MSYRVFGFVLRTRKWEKLDLTHLTGVARSGSDCQSDKDGQIAKTAFDRLVLPESHKKMVQSLIAQHFRDKESSQNKEHQFDIVRGKGKGLIILLHGAPGVGKTSTAEGVAELFQKPLFQITCGDLGSTATEVEKTLEMNFALANRWGCILLLDEADVFLSARNLKDFIRNGLVAVFLRVLEYYAGILFLTTNRIGDFDEAFASRIHISLYYPPLDLNSTEQIFRLNLEVIKERMHRKGTKLEIDKKNILAYAREYWEEHRNARWNGRQIRNACQTALALAEFEAQGGSHEKVRDPNAVVVLEDRHVQDVAESYLEFMEYLRELYGTDGGQRAKEGGLRVDRMKDPDDRLRRWNPLKQLTHRQSGRQRQRPAAPEGATPRAHDRRRATTPRQPRYPDAEPAASRPRYQPPAQRDAPEDYGYSEGEYPDDTASLQASHVPLFRQRRDNPDEHGFEDTPRCRQRGDYRDKLAASAPDLSAGYAEDDDQPDVVEDEPPHEEMSTPSTARAGRRQPADPRPRRSRDRQGPR